MLHVINPFMTYRFVMSFDCAMVLCRIQQFLLFDFLLNVLFWISWSVFYRGISPFSFEPLTIHALIFKGWIRHFGKCGIHPSHSKGLHRVVINAIGCPFTILYKPVSSILLLHSHCDVSIYIYTVYHILLCLLSFIITEHAMFTDI